MNWGGTQQESITSSRFIRKKDVSMALSVRYSGRESGNI